jgi:hypothetical protein
VKGESSTASEVNGSHSEDKDGKPYSNNGISPKEIKANPWSRQQKSRSGGRKNSSLEKDRSNSDFDDFKDAAKTKIKSPDKDNLFMREERNSTGGLIRDASSMRRFSSQQSDEHRNFQADKAVTQGDHSDRKNKMSY